MKFKVVCLQINGSQNPKKNFEKLDLMFKSSKIKNVDLICLPECSTIFSDNIINLENYFLNWHKKFLSFFESFARKKKVHIMIGSTPHMKKNKKFFNRSIILNDKGLKISHYDKINLFDVNLNSKEKYMESKIYDSGKKLTVTKLPWGKLGMTVCYDIRFPSIYKKLAKKGANLFTIPAAFTYTTGKAHWDVLVRNRAIENGCFVFAPAQCGNHDNGRITFGNSMIVNPWGKVLKKANFSEEIISSNIDLREVLNCRDRIPATTNYKL